MAQHQYVESAVREGSEKGPWESLREQAVLGGEKFLAEVKAHVSGDAQEQRGARRLLAKRPSLSEVIQAAETVKGQCWDEFRDRYGDTGRDMVLYLGRRLCGLKLTVLAQSVGLGNYAVVAASARRYEERLKQDAMEKINIKKMFKLLNYKICRPHGLSAHGLSVFRSPNKTRQPVDHHGLHSHALGPAWLRRPLGVSSRPV